MFWGPINSDLTLSKRLSWTVLPCTFVSRLLLNIRERACIAKEAGERGWNSTTGTGVQLSTIVII